MLVGNTLFSPPKDDSLHYFIFNLNWQGLENGVLGALKRDSMILISFCWLSTIDSLTDFYEALKFIKPVNQIILTFLKWMQNMNQEFTLFYQSLTLRIISKNKNLSKKFRLFRLVAIAAINRIFLNIGKMTYTGESHKNIEFANTNEVSINLENVSIGYSENSDVLKNISINIKPGEFIFVAGADCSGKSTLLKVFAGYIPKIDGYITSGEILISEQSINNIELNEITSRIKLFTNYSDDLFIGLTVEQEIMNFTNNIQQAKEILTELDLIKYWKTETVNLSGGEKIKLLFATALISKAQILLFDSPLSQIDPVSRPEFIKLIKKLNNNKKTIVIADNQYGYYSKDVSKFILLENGRIKEILNPVEWKVQELTKKAEPVDINLLNFIQENQAAKKTLVTIKNSQLKIKDKVILNSINISVHSKEVIAVLGANGSGKTSLMHLLSGIYLPTNTDYAVKRECNIGMVFQNPVCQILEITVGKEISIGPLLNEWDKKKKDEFINEAKQWIEESLDTQTLDIHPSQTKMLASVSTNLHSKIMIFDEPTLDIDNSNINRLIRYIKNLFDSGTSIVIVTHDLRIIDIATRFWVMSKGNISIDTNNKQKALDYLMS